MQRGSTIEGDRIGYTRQPWLVSRPARWLVIGAGAMFCAGCAQSVYSTLGTTAGGVQDGAAARSIILDGGIPDPEAITVEGFLSEHEIPLSAPATTGTLYPQFGVSWRQPFGAAAGQAELYLGIGTTINLDSFTRPPLNLAIVVDRSDSMKEAVSGVESRPKLLAVKQALSRLADRLHFGDQLTLVSFNTWATVDLPPTPGDRRGEIDRAIAGLVTSGGTNLEAGLRLATEQLVGSIDSDRSSRIILFTDALPNSGATESDDILPLLETNAAMDIGFTLMGVGLDYGTELANDISQVRGGNAFFLSDAERIAGVFDEEFDLLVTPVAYDVTLNVDIPAGTGVAAVYGVPDYLPGTAGARVTIPTLFLSRREGGGEVVVRLSFAAPPDFAQAVSVASVSLSYRLLSGESESSTFEMTLPAGLTPQADPPYFSDDGAYRAALLVDTVLAIREAVEGTDEGRSNAAYTMLGSYLPYFDRMSQGLSDRTDPTSRGLSEERDLIETLTGTLSRCANSYYGCSSDFYPYRY